MRTEPSCPVCRASARVLFSYVVPESPEAQLCRCSACSFTFVADPHWLAASFSPALHRLDVGSADRSLLVASFVRGMLGRRGTRARWKVLDVGGGDGLLARHLRDQGIDCRWTDPYCTPVYWVGPEVTDRDRFDLAVMSEVALHLTDPIATFGQALACSDRLLFTAAVPPDPITPDWWYLMPSTGQHVAFYPLDAIAEIARRLGVHWCSDGRFFHLLSRAPISRSLRARVERREVSLLLAEWYDVLGLVDRARGRSRSLAVADQAAAEAEMSARTERDGD